MFYALKESDKKGQVTVFIIVAVLIIAGIVLYFVLSSDSGGSQEVSGDQEVQSPSAFLESCMEDEIRSNLRKMRLRGGFLNASPSVSFKFVNDTNPISRDIAYLCYASSPGSACVVQNAGLVSGIERGLEREMSSLSEGCFSDLKDAYENEGYSISGGNYDSSSDLVMDLTDNNLEVMFNASEMTLSKTNETQSIKDFKFNIPSVTYNLAEVANYIVEQESNVGSIDTGQFVQDYPEFRIDYETLQDQSRIYTLEHRDTNTKFRFAVRSYPLP